MKRSVRKLALGLALATASGGVGIGLVNPSAASALCVSPLETGVWWNQTSQGESKVEIEMIDCGDQVLNGVQTTSKYRVNVWVRQSSGDLYHRGQFITGGQMHGGDRWIVVRVPVGGYVQEMWMRATEDTRPAQRMRVWIHHESLDSKPSYTSDSYFLRTPPAPKGPSVADPAICQACQIGG